MRQEGAGTELEREGHLRELHGRGEFHALAAAAIELYGAEVFGYLVCVLRDESEADDVFSLACENLWRGISVFEGRCSLRTWFYTLARHAIGRHRRASRRDAGRRVPLSQTTSPLAAQIRSVTLPYLRTQFRERFNVLLEALTVDERTLLVLRVDRALDWNEIAFVMIGPELCGDDLARASARLRKRFQALKARLRERAHESGLLPSEDP